MTAPLTLRLALADYASGRARDAETYAIAAALGWTINLARIAGGRVAAYDPNGRFLWIGA